MNINKYTKEYFENFLFKDQELWKYFIENHKSSNKMSGSKLLEVLNSVVFDVEQGVYLEIGTYCGASLIAAAKNNKGVQCYGVDNFSQGFGHQNMRQNLDENIKTFNKEENITFIEKDYRELLDSDVLDNSVDVYFYDGPHSEQDQYDGVAKAIKKLKKKGSIIMVDDAACKEQIAAKERILKDFSNIKEIFSEKEDSGKDGFWNGLDIFYYREG